MQRSELLQQLKQPRLIADLAAGSIVALGLFGCFHPARPVKSLSLSALMAGVATLAGNTAIARLYAEAAGDILERELSSVSELSQKLEEWKVFWAQKHQEFADLQAQLQQAQQAIVESRRGTDFLQATIASLESEIEQKSQEHQQSQALQQQLVETQAALKTAQAEAAESRRHVETLQKRFDDLVASHQQERQQHHHTFESLAVSVKQFMSQAIVEYRDRLLSAIETSARQRPDDYRDRLLRGAKESSSQTLDLLPQLQRLAGEVRHVAGDHLLHITKLPHFSDPQSFLQEAISLLQQEFEELSALKVRYRNTLNTGDKRIFQSEIVQLRVELDQLRQDAIPRSQHEAILSEFQTQKNAAFQTVVEQLEALETELNGDTEAYVQQLLSQIEAATREIANLKRRVEELSQPLTFRPATRDDHRMGNIIIEYFYRHGGGIILDRAGSDYHKHEATLFFHIDRNPRIIVPKDLNDHADKLVAVVHCLNIPQFEYDSESGLMKVKLQLTQKPRIDPATVLKTVGTAEDFLNYLSANPISYRIIGDKGRGKTPLMAVMVSHFFRAGGRKGNVPNGMKMSKVLVGVSYPNAEFSQKDKGRYPLEPFLFARNTEQCKQAIATIYQDYQRRRDPTMSKLVDNFFQIWIIDEADNTLDFSAEGSASKMRSIFNDGGHGNTGWIFAGQSVNTRVLKGWTNDDRKKSTEIILEAAKIKAWANAYGGDYYGSERLKSMLANVDAVREAIEKENESICDEAKRLRLALVADSISPKLFLLPSFDSIDFDLEAYSEVRREADGILAGLSSKSFQIPSNMIGPSQVIESDSTIPGNPVELPYVGVCPDCGMESSDRKGKPESGKQRYFCRNPKCSKKTFTVSLKQSINCD